MRLLPSRLYVIKAALVRARSLLWLMRRRGRSYPPGVRILAYHRVSDEPDPLAVTPRRFAEQMAVLAAGRYTLVDLAEAAEMLRRGEAPPRSVALTFDDGYLDIVRHALPVLARHGFMATVFVVPGAIDGDVSFEWYEHQPELIGWPDVVRLDRSSPLRFEAHTTTHPNLLMLAEDDARREISGCKEQLEHRLGRPARAFCYPGGLFGAREIALVEQAGYRTAVSCEPGINGPRADPFALARVQIDARDGLLDFRAKLGGGHDRPLPLRALHRRIRYGVTSTPRAASSER